MQAVDFKGVMNIFLADESRKIPQEHLRSICKIRCSEKTCRYICAIPTGYVCTKKTPIKVSLDNMVKENKMNSHGDNCEGLGNPV